MQELGCFLLPPLVFSLLALLATGIVVISSIRKRLAALEESVARLSALPPPAEAHVSTEPEAPPASPDPERPPAEVIVPAAAAEKDVPLSAPAFTPEPISAIEPAAPTTSNEAPLYEPQVAFSEAREELFPAAIQRPPAAPTGRLSSAEWESLIGVKLFSWIAGIAMALAALLLLRYSIEHGWLQPPVQMAIGLVSGLVLIAICEMKIANDFRATANAMDGAGVAILYATLFAAHSVWHLTSGLVSFLLMASVTALAVYLAIRRDSVFIAILGLLGGFATPALLATGEDRPIALFGYLLIVNLGIAWVAYRKTWPILTAASLVFTTIYQWVWVDRFLTGNKLPMAITIFLVFPVVALIVLGLARRGTTSTKDRAFERTATFGAALPILFGIYASAVPAYGTEFRILFGFLFIIAAGLAVLAAVRGPASLHLLGGLSTVLAVIAWLANSYTPGAWPLILLVTAAFVAIYLAAEPLARLAGKPIEAGGARAVFAAPLLLLVFPTLAAIEPRAENGILLFGTLLVLFAAIGFYAVRFSAGSIFVVAAVLTIVTQTIWSHENLSAPYAGRALVTHSAFAILMMVVAALGSRAGARAMRLAYWLSLSGFAFLGVVAGNTIFSTPPWLLFAALMAVLIAAGWAARYSRTAAVWGASLVAAQWVIILWGTGAYAHPWPSIATVAALVIASLGGVCLFLLRRNDAAVEARGWERIRTDRFARAFAAGLFGAQAVLFDAAMAGGRPSTVLLAFAQVAVIAALLWLSAWRGWHRLATATAIMTGLCLLSFPATRTFIETLGFALALFLPFLLYPVVLGRRLEKHFQPHVAAVIASLFVFLDLWQTIDDRGWNGWAGALPIALAAIFGLLLLHLLRHEPAGSRHIARLALVAATVLGYITVAVPLQLDREWITISWALMAAALAWLYTRIPHNGLVVWASGLGTIVFVRLAVNPSVLSYHPRGNAPILNWYMYTYAVPAIAFLAASYFLSRAERSPEPRMVRGAASLFSAAAVILLFLLLNIEIADFYSSGEHLTFDFSSTLAQDLTYTLGWAIFAILLLIAGILLEKRSVRIASLALLVIAILKCFLHDLARLGGLYRVGSLLGLALALTLVAVLLQRFIFRKPEVDSVM